MEKNQWEIREFLLKNLPDHPQDIVSLLASTFGFTRQRAHFYLAREVKKGTVVRVGKTRATRYFLVGSKKLQVTLPLKSVTEDRVWGTYIRPMLNDYPENVQRVANYGFTEMLNNAIDHSEGTEVWIDVEITDKALAFVIMDNGVGIFQKIKDALKLESEREAILHLSKGKFTTDPSRHTGEGIFFTSRMVDAFSILSDDLFYVFQGWEWFSSPEKPEPFGRGTSIRMVINLDTKRTPKEVLDKYSNAEIGFHKTIVSVGLSSDPSDPHVSRSQAKRLMAGTEKFRTVILDFRGVKEVGQAFVDEIFRVFQNEHPSIRIAYANANPDVEAMIKRGLAESQAS
ncbi:MAG TPA: DUF4325 domain-containing protein [Candidatus Paceibacterota bacterium]|nr:DUF4325 domain-containing protein [Candidatus Paceibacterota bacterium]